MLDRVGEENDVHDDDHHARLGDDERLHVTVVERMSHTNINEKDRRLMPR